MRPFHFSMINSAFVFLFIMTLIFFQMNWFTLTFVVLLLSMILLMFMQEKQRIFVWIMVAYFLGEMIYLYGNLFIDHLSFSINISLIVDKLLLLFPIALIYYVCRKFKNNVVLSLTKPIWNTNISFSIIKKQYMISLKNFMIMSFSVTIIIFLPFILYENSAVDLHRGMAILLYASISSIMEEVLWRGLIMSAIKNLTNERTAIIFSSIGFGISYLMYGYSLGICLILILFGFLFAWITSRSGSIVPAMIWHFLFHILMILSGVFLVLPSNLA